MICKECETVAHCTKHGCIPKQPSVDLRTAAKQALEALIRADRISGYPNNKEAITALRQALEQPAQQEPYGYLKLNTGRFAHEVKGCPDPAKEGYLPLYTFPQAREPLTDEEIDDLADFHGLDLMAYRPFARAVEAAHGIGEKK